MGEIADLMLEGSLCEGCGEDLGDGDGYPRRCVACDDVVPVIRARPQKAAKPPRVPCQICGRKIRPSGFWNHNRDVHQMLDGEPPKSGGSVSPDSETASNRRKERE